MFAQGNLPRFDRPQQLALELDGQFSDLVEKDGAAVGRLEVGHLGGRRDASFSAPEGLHGLQARRDSFVRHYAQQ